MPNVLLKCRPTLAQLADRLRPPRPDGIELYLDAADLAGDEVCREVVARVKRFQLPPGFPIVVEGPIRTLDGTFFDTTRLSPANRLLVERLTWVGEALGAEAVLVHLIAPRVDRRSFAVPASRRLAERSARFLAHYAARAIERGLQPLIENMPPILRMREGRALATPLGMPAEDLVAMVEAVPGLRVTLDLSHAGLYVNARRLAARPPTASCQVGDLAPSLLAEHRMRGVSLPAFLVRFLQGLPEVDDVATFADRLTPWLYSLHVSNARGVEGEGLPYDDGELPLDDLVLRLVPHVRHAATETIEPDPDHAVHMRTAQRRLLAALAGVVATGG